MSDGETKTHARIGTALLVLITWTGIVVNFVEWREAVENLRIGQTRQNDVDATLLHKIELTRDRVDAKIDQIKDKAELSARLEERLEAMQRQLDKMETLIRRKQ